MAVCVQSSEACPPPPPHPSPLLLWFLTDSGVLLMLNMLLCIEFLSMPHKKSLKSHIYSSLWFLGAVK